MKIQKTFLVLAFMLAALTVIIGAFGAHGLKAKITPEQLKTYETGISYQFYHTFALIVTSLLMNRMDSSILTYAALAFLFGIVCFSGSLYLLSTRELLGLTSWRWLGPITPIGGVAFIVGWILLAVGVWKA